MYRIRFHLARGIHYLHWQVRGDDGSVKYYDPKQYQLEMINCRLVNKLNEAKKVNFAGVKDVCGWIECEDYNAINSQDSLVVDDLESLTYNPIKDVHWRRSGDDGEFYWDNYTFDMLITSSNRVYVATESCALV